MCAYLGAYMLLSGKLFDFCLYLAVKVVEYSTVVFVIVSIALLVISVACLFVFLRLSEGR